jgi:tetratricopeptide (TPR) repeat protein
MTATASPASGSSRWILVAGSFILVLLIAYWMGWLSPRRNTAHDPVAATAANARGVGWMEQFEYAKATAEFEQAAALAPDWRPARINLGMSLYNSAGGADDPVLPRAIAVFEQILREEPDNPYAHFNLGIIKKYRGDYREAAEHFTRVTQIDPRDDRAWLYLGQSDPDMQSSPEAKAHFEKAITLNPYLVPARYAIANHLLTTEAEQTKLHELNERLRQANWEDEARPDRHSEQGRYATVIGKGLVEPPAIGPMPMFEQKNSTRIEGQITWAKDPSEPHHKTVRDLFGGVMIRLDYNRDGKPDLLLLSAVTRNGKTSDLLLQNEGDHFTNVSEPMGLGSNGSFGGAVGDFDNDGWPDLALTTATGVRLLRNREGKSWEDKTAEAGFGENKEASLAVCWIDLDQDGDLDLLVGSLTTKGVTVYQNVGTAPPSRADEPTPPLTCAFKPLVIPEMNIPGRIQGIVATDLDGDKDVDLIFLPEGKAPVVVLNDRLMRFHVGSALPTTSTGITGGLIFDANGDEQSDLFLTTTGKPVFLTSRKDLPDNDFAKRFSAGISDAPDMRQGQRCDLDWDGRADIVGLSKDGKPVFLHGDGQGKLSKVTVPFGPVPDGLANVFAVMLMDVDGDCHPDYVAWTKDGLHVYRGLGNGNRGLKLSFTGKRDNNNAGSGQKNLRTNSDGFGTKVQSITGSLISMVELTTLSSGPGQSLVPVEIGIGRAMQADAVRVRWPDCVVQAELATASCEIVTIGEINRKPTSCPVLMTWDGTKWVYVTDFLGGGALGECGADGSVRPARPEESVKIEAHQLDMRDGQYVLRIAEPMDEVMYLDRLRLRVVDHPGDSLVFPDERFAVAEPLPTQTIHTYRKRITPVKAVDHRGVDRTKTIAERDSQTVDGLAHRSWLGFAEEHWLEFDFGNRMATLSKDKPWHLVLAGWTDYPYPESIIAAGQAGIAMLPPVLERKTDKGWERVADIGFPAGLPKVMTVPVPDMKSGGTRFRIRTNLQIYWDHIQLAEAETTDRVNDLSPKQATLSHPGFVQEILHHGKPPQAYDPNRFETVAVTKWQGTLTRFGDVTELIAGLDDRFVLCGPGDEVMVTFDATSLPELPKGWTRSYVLQTNGYCKDTSPTTLTGGSVGPMPYRGMKTYPPREPGPAIQLDDIKNWHTRPAGGLR